MGTNVLGISSLDEMATATRPWFVQSLQQLCGDFFSRYVNAFKTSDSSRGLFWIFSFYVWYSTLLHLPPLRFHCVGGCWIRTPGQLRLRHWLSDALTTRLDLIHNRLDLIYTRLDLIHFDLSLTLSHTLAVDWVLFWSEESSFIDHHLRHTYKGQRKDRG